MTGEAIDFEVPGLTVPEIVLVTETIPYFRDGGIGAYIECDKERVHGDVRRGKARWLYKNGQKQTWKQMLQEDIFEI